MSKTRAQTETFRHQCEVRELLNASADEKRGESWVNKYLDHPKVAGRRAVLARDLIDQTDKGNDGRAGLWL